jgi:hypothetical protein
MGFDHAYYDIGAFEPPPATLSEHLKCLADTRRSAKKNAQLPATFLFCLLQEGIWGWAVLGDALSHAKTLAQPLRLCMASRSKYGAVLPFYSGHPLL